MVSPEETALCSDFKYPVMLSVELDDVLLVSVEESVLLVESEVLESRSVSTLWAVVVSPD